MRTTLNLAEDALIAARNIAQREHLPLGEAVSELIRRASSPSSGLKKKGDIWVFALPDDAPRVTAAHVKALLDESS